MWETTWLVIQSLDGDSAATRRRHFSIAFSLGGLHQKIPPKGCNLSPLSKSITAQ